MSKYGPKTSPGYDKTDYQFGVQTVEWWVASFGPVRKLVSAPELKVSLKHSETGCTAMGEPDYGTGPHELDRLHELGLASSGLK